MTIDPTDAPRPKMIERIEAERRHREHETRRRVERSGFECPLCRKYPRGWAYPSNWPFPYVWRCDACGWCYHMVPPELYLETA